MKTYYYVEGKEVKGPFAWAVLKRMYKAGKITLQTQVVGSGGTDWMPWGELVKNVRLQWKKRLGILAAAVLVFFAVDHYTLQTLRECDIKKAEAITSQLIDDPQRGKKLRELMGRRDGQWLAVMKFLETRKIARDNKEAREISEDYLNGVFDRCHYFCRFFGID